MWTYRNVYRKLVLNSFFPHGLEPVDIIFAYIDSHL